MKPHFNAFLCLLATATPASALEPLSSYTSFTTYVLPPICTEASAIAFRPDTQTLFIIGDEGGDLIKVSKNGEFLSKMNLKNFNSAGDPEGLAYLGAGRFMVGSERNRTGYVVTYTADGLADRFDATAHIFEGDGTIGANDGLEGVCYDPSTNSVWGIREVGPPALYRMAPFETAGQNVIINPFHPRVYGNNGLADLADIYVPSACPAFAGSGREANLLILSQASNKIMEITRTGTVIGLLDIAFLDRPQVEGITMDDQGVMYLVSEEVPTRGENKNSRFHVLTPPVPVFNVRTLTITSPVAGMWVGDFTWDSLPGKSYVIEYSPDLDGDWQPVSETYLATGVTTSGTSSPVSGNSGRGFFRVKRSEP